MKACFVGLFALAALQICPLAASAQLAVTVGPAKITASKAVVKLDMKNNFAEKVESAKAVCFLTDEQGKVVGQSSKWVIGGAKDRPALEPGKETEFNFVIPIAESNSCKSEQFVSTNLTAKVTFSRVVLEGGKLADATKQVSVTTTAN
jgi:hypothetical protein